MACSEIGSTSMTRETESPGTDDGSSYVYGPFRFAGLAAPDPVGGLRLPHPDCGLPPLPCQPWQTLGEVPGKPK